MTKYVKNVFGFRYLAICASCGHCIHEQIDYAGVLRQCQLHLSPVRMTDVCPDWVSESKYSTMKYSEKPGSIKNGEYLHYLANIRDGERKNKYSTFATIESIREQWEQESGNSIYIKL